LGISGGIFGVLAFLAMILQKIPDFGNFEACTQSKSNFFQIG